jgi:formylglycine-generating enzyme required for sulfatase activity
MARGRHAVTDNYHIFLSYSRNDKGAAALLRAQLERSGLSVFKDDERIRAGELWLDRLQEAVDGCGAFVVLVGRDGVRRWIGAETQAALNRYFGPHDDAKRLPIFPILLNDTGPETLPAFLRLFQMTPWSGADPLPERLLGDIRERKVVNEAIPFEGCPFVGLAAYRPDQAHLFFGRQKETLDALACFETRGGRAPVRWLEINGSSGSGKSSLMNAGLLPLIDQGWLWPRTGYAGWHRIGPMMPGERPLPTLAECLARAFTAEMADVRSRLEADDRSLTEWLRSRKRDETAFLLAIDQFEELFTFADADERRRFDRLLAAALEDPECPLFVISTVRADFLDRFAENLPRLVDVQNRLGKAWKLAPIGPDSLREVIDGPARLAGLDVSEIKEVMVAEARDEPGALPLVENALHWLWQEREGNRLSGRLFNEQGGLAGILSRSADGLLDNLAKPQRDRALELLFQLVKVDPEGSRHARQRMTLAEAMDVAGGGEAGRALVNRLAGERLRDSGKTEGPLRLITVTQEAERSGVTTAGGGRWVNLIHETLIRSKGLDAAGKPQPHWPTLWAYIEKNKERATRRERLQLMAREWKDRRGLARLFGVAGWSSLFAFRWLAAPSGLEQRYLRWSRARAAVEAVALAATLGIISEGVSWAMKLGAPFAAVRERWAYILGFAEPPLSHLIEIPAGSFRMGSERDGYSKPVHSVTFAHPFSFGKTEVTFREWDACVADGGCEYRPADQGWGRDTRPVINVSWQDAQSYVFWLSRKRGADCRLPSEAEWEYAARAGTTTEYALPAPDGSDDIRGKALANCIDCGGEWGGKQTAPVAWFRANAWDLYDMHGNVYEWVEDCWHDDYEDAPGDGSAWREEDGGNCNFPVLRGGSWFGVQVFARSAFRIRHFPSSRSLYVGFRVVCSSPIFGP